MPLLRSSSSSSSSRRLIAGTLRVDCFLNGYFGYELRFSLSNPGSQADRVEIVPSNECQEFGLRKSAYPGFYHLGFHS
ncbi:faah2a [Gossypium arboreum]|uniref:Faah2a n=1 Tax=Gossypium arboreum TaxID=29729 RepID=A0A0B0PUB4_GOSAR|nr:faah2a [Gossypium arboreum]